MKWRHSLRYRVLMMTAISLLLLCTVIIGYNLHIFRVMEKQADTAIVSTLELYTEEVELSLENIESFLVNQCLDQDVIRKIRQPREQLDRYLTVGEVQDLFETSIDSYHLMNGLFMYDREDSIYIGESNLKGDQDYAQMMSGVMGILTKTFEERAQVDGNEWFSVEINEEYFLVKMFEVQGVYVGSWVRVDSVMERLQGVSVDTRDYVLMLDSENTVLSHDVGMEILEDETEDVKVDGVRYKIIRAETESEIFSFVVLQRQGGFGSAFVYGRVQILFSAVFVVLLCFVMTMVEKRFFDVPIERLVNAMNQLKEGNLDVRIREENIFDEFRVVNDAFDDMINEIQKLKIDVYEEKLNKQRTELLYLQEQINPHFLTNCMNLIRNLAIMGDTEKVQAAAVLVSNHIRYSLAYSTVVPLNKELGHVANYVKLQKMRYGDEFLLTVEKEDYLDECKVPTMLLQVFVENAIKHQLDPDRQLLIRVSIWEKNGEELHICIQDSGEGFPEDILRKLNAHKKLINSDGEHIGIYNVCQRLDIMYGESADIRFLNGESGGARIEIRIPSRF